MKIDCPHCGVHGSVDDSLAGKKLRCPKCTKVFLVTDDMVPESGGNDLVQQELLHDPPEVPREDGPADVSDESSTSAAEQALEEELEKIETGSASTEADSSEVADITDSEMFDPMPVQEVVEESVETTTDDDSEGEPPMDTCSSCGQSFASAFLVEVDSKLYCALCQPEEEADEEENEPDAVEAEQEQESSVGDEDFLGFSGEEEEPQDESEEVADNLDVCAGCGESLHPQFLDSYEGKQYCALCFPGEEVQEADAAEEVLESDVREEPESDSVDESVLNDEQVKEPESEEDTETGEEEGEDAEAILNVAGEEQDEGEEAGELTQEVCSVCGESFHKDFLQEVDSKLYCGVCQPEVIETIPMEGAAAVNAAVVGTTDDDTEVVPDIQTQGTDFTIGDLLREAWQKTKGAKGAVWGGTLIMYLIIFGVSLGGVSLTEDMLLNNPAKAMPINMGLQFITSWLSMILGGGLMLIGVRRALEKRVRWKMVFAAFSKKKVIAMTIASILQIILICIGFLLLVLPGIYLSVGYALTLPLILEKGLGPWEALETSRKAIHTRWWSVLGAYFGMALLYLVSAIPLGLGLIWTVPMFMVLIGVLYVRFFGPTTAEEEDIDAAEEEDENAASEVEDVEEVTEESETQV